MGYNIFLFLVLYVYVCFNVFNKQVKNVVIKVFVMLELYFMFFIYIIIKKIYIII